MVKMRKHRKVRGYRAFHGMYAWQARCSRQIAWYMENLKVDNTVEFK